MPRKCYPRLWIFSALCIVLDQKSCETLETVICGGPRHVSETIRLKRCQNTKAVRQEMLCEYFFWKTSQNLQENICDEDLF